MLDKSGDAIHKFIKTITARRKAISLVNRFKRRGKIH